MPKAILFDLYETLITESQTRPAGVASLAPLLGCEREAFRSRWKALRPAVMAGHVSFAQSLRDITASLGAQADEGVVQRVCRDRIRVKALPFADVENEVLAMIDGLRDRGVRLGVVSNGLAEDVTAWDGCALAPRVDCRVFSFELGAAKPDARIYESAVRQLEVNAADAWFVGDGADDELVGAERAGLRAFRALWFLRRWPHFRDEPSSTSRVAAPAEIVRLVDSARG